MREIVLDTETTGLDPATGDRIVEIGAVELVNYLPTGRHFHRYINPGRPVPADAVAVHGLDDAFLRDKPPFTAIVAEFLAFIGDDARLVIHNAPFDIRFLNHELTLTGHPALPWSRALCTLALAREKLPGAASSLDALCQRFGVDNSGRDLHGALLDSQLLAEVYLELVGGRQTTIAFEVVASASPDAAAQSAAPRRTRPQPLAPRLTEAERAAHAAFVATLGEAAVWRRYGAS
ncbi:DNA polymerase III subunit epsilon [Paracoccus sp. S-4012]|uniref:DNA polymerase III subunit epsilon n=1 Tax=Paracoccus sp. S-4012 TaxID=2665648 RepID=UPI0012B07D85|nr:DNA polymerase III subunit epsilon [Paracoccus sp. S-4012]MRX49854.1 DNA polymerase III subunit epsilon [Paracoccus sp. S-4012]